MNNDPNPSGAPRPRLVCLSWFLVGCMWGWVSCVFRHQYLLFRGEPSPIALSSEQLGRTPYSSALRQTGMGRLYSVMSQAREGRKVSPGCQEYNNNNNNNNHFAKFNVVTSRKITRRKDDIGRSSGDRVHVCQMFHSNSRRKREAFKSELDNLPRSKRAQQRQPHSQTHHLFVEYL